MSNRGKLVGFAAILAASFGVGLAVGSAVGPIDVGGSPTESEHPAHESGQHDPSHLPAADADGLEGVQP
jgi:hypothetical protein